MRFVATLLYIDSPIIENRQRTRYETSAKMVVKCMLSVAWLTAIEMINNGVVYLFALIFADPSSERR